MVTIRRTAQGKDIFILNKGDGVLAVPFNIIMYIEKIPEGMFGSEKTKLFFAASDPVTVDHPYLDVLNALEWNNDLPSGQ